MKRDTPFHSASLSLNPKLKILENFKYLNSSGITSKASILILIPQRPLVTESLDELVALMSGDDAPSIILSFDWSKYKSSSLIDSSSGDNAELFWIISRSNQGHLGLTWPSNLPSSPRTIIQFTCESSFCGKDEVVIVTAPKHCWGFISRIREVVIQSHVVYLRSILSGSIRTTERFRDEN